MSVVLTKEAAKKVQRLLQDQDSPNMKLRVFVSGGGCSGFQYGFTFDDDIRDTDEVVENYGVGLLVDPMSLDLLKGAEIDYQTSLQGESFVIRNPNAASTCGCGKSFTPSDAGAGCSHAG